MKKFAELVAAEIARARDVHPRNMTTYHDGYATVLEELDELWDLVKLKPRLLAERRADLLEECVQVAAMAQRFAEDLLGDMVRKEGEDGEDRDTGGATGPLAVEVG